MSEPQPRTTVAPEQRAQPFSVTRSFVLLIFISHLTACVGVLVLMPGGWPTWSAETFTYRVVPLLMVALIVTAIVRPSWRRTDRLVLALLTGAWSAATLLSLWMFSVSGQQMAMGANVVAVGLMLTALRFKRFSESRSWTGFIPVIVGALLAVMPMSLLRSPPASTRPLGGTFDFVSVGSSERRTLRLDANFALDTSQATVTVTAGRRYAYIEPVLTFLQRSPDACWTIFAPKTDRLPPPRSLNATSVRDAAFEATYTEGGDGIRVADSRLILRREAEGHAEIHAATSLNLTQWSHLNTFTQLTVAGHRTLRLRFSPAPDIAIEVKHAGYPFGAPARFAYIDRGGVFHVVEASSGEKGPFRELAAGPLHGPLTVTLLDDEEPFLEIELRDWAAQASREPSPAAGDGVPQNAIEFGLLSEDPKSSATIFVSLASTSVGRGWSSVGHGAGVYQNRMTVRVLTPRKFETTRPAS